MHRQQGNPLRPKHLTFFWYTIKIFTFKPQNISQYRKTFMCNLSEKEWHTPQQKHCRRWSKASLIGGVGSGIIHCMLVSFLQHSHSWTAGKYSQSSQQTTICDAESIIKEINFKSDHCVINKMWRQSYIKPSPVTEVPNWKNPSREKLPSKLININAKFIVHTIPNWILPN